MPKTLDPTGGSGKTETAKVSRRGETRKGAKKSGSKEGARRPAAGGVATSPRVEGGAGRPKAVAPRVLDSVRKEIVSRFPEMRGVRPSVVRRKVPADVGIVDMIGKINGELGATLARMKTTARKVELYCASFEKKIKTSGGSTFQKIVRVTFDKEGHILKLISSK